jgi:type II secretory ATPase GspE/PulE/Tfp pilus assembly ATPase PilB-like protein
LAYIRDSPFAGGQARRRKETCPTSTEENTVATVPKETTAAGRFSRDGAVAARGEAQVHSLRLELRADEPDQVVPRLIEYAAQLHVSDLFFNSEEDSVDIAVRHLGLVRAISSLPGEMGRRCISYVKTMANMNISERRRPLDGRWLYRSSAGDRLDLRINTIPTLHGEDCTIRILDQGYHLLSLDQLGLDPPLHNQLMQLLNSPSGLLLVAGPTETGKSTTLYACLSYLNNGERKINTIEDPIEYSLKGIRQSQVQTALGVGFDELLRHVLRQAPDVIMIGEIRDAETAMTAVRAAGSGHLVLSTLHAPVATAAVQSMLRLGVHSHLLSTSLLGVISQRLLRTLCPRCKASFPIPAAHVFDEVRQWLQPGEGQQLCGPQGCPECHQTGYAARTAIFEMLTATAETREMIDDRAPAAALRKKAVEGGMIELRHSALLKVARGQTSIEEVVRILPSEYLK